jgi:hypothetical protein
MLSTRISLLSMFQQQYTGVLQRDKTEGLPSLWSYLTGDVVWSSPAVANGVVYVGSTDGNVYALSARTGCQAVELHHRLLCGILARRSEWGGLCWLVRRQSLRLRPEEGFGASKSRF